MRARLLRPALTLLLVLGGTPPVLAARSILDLQTHKHSEQLKLTAPRGGTTTVRLTNLNPVVSAWYLLELTAGGKTTVYNLENPHPTQQRLHLRADAPGSLLLTDYLGTRACPLWSAAGQKNADLRTAADSARPFVPLCDGRVLLRNHADGHRSTKELVVDLLRDHIFTGEAITGFFKETLFKDKYRLAADAAVSVGALLGPARLQRLGPKPAAVAAGDQTLAPRQLGLHIAGTTGASLVPGRWYPAAAQAGVWVSEVSASRLAADVLASYPGSVARLDPVEANSLAYLVAFDLDRFGLGFALGTDHPRVDWSTRAAGEQDRHLAGPDGFATAAPLVQSGLLSPAFRDRVVATFAGGFKRVHGAFKWGELAKRNHGSHYGFIEDGVVFSRLQPGLATLYVKVDGTFGIKTWTESDAALVPMLRYARQNGVPLIERSESGPGRPSPYVADWARGNWSGSADKKQRTLRSGLCLQQQGERRYLVYGYFSSATPSAMTRVFQAYGCDYAMHLDMNAPEHTYMALYRDDGQGRLGVEHLVKAMAAYDGKAGDHVAPRFVEVPDSRDFVFLYRKNQDFER